ncbi:MAG: FAD:protein FMN transferase [Paludibacteraceae bacterium]|nr:FAD:protein FMN transferase [Paludibacteraceae bacterium]
MKDQIQKIILPLLLVGAAVVVLVWQHDEKAVYHCHQGYVFGTYYNIRYSSTKDLEQLVLKTMQDFDNSMSTFNKASTISRINTNQSDTTDLFFEQMYAVAQEISQLSDGAFDITVAPLVNAWGFGFRNKEKVTPQLIDSLRSIVGYRTISIHNHHLVKTNPSTMIDASAIAKGQACDVVAQVLSDNGCKNVLVDIGGEVVCRGVNDKGEPWRVGITKPQDDPDGSKQELQEIISTTGLNMATSGNYRQFYYDGDVRRSHTIDPRTGYPAESDILSATIATTSCMRADALATACMVLGSDSALALINRLPDTECYLICATQEDSLIIKKTTDFFAHVEKKE